MIALTTATPLKFIPFNSSSTSLSIPPMATTPIGLLSQIWLKNSRLKSELSLVGVALMAPQPR